MSEETSKASGGVGFLGLLFITFLALKLTHVIDWSWWLVTAPLWGVFAILLAIALIGGLVMLGHFLYIKAKNRL